MAELLHEIEWGMPLIDAGPGAKSDVELRKRLSPWLAEAVSSFFEPEKVSYAPLKLLGISYFVASQENACCYGEAGALMKIRGCSDRQIQDLEHEADLAGGQARNVVELARKLAKSNPSPARKGSEALSREGLSREAVSEIAACGVKACFANRLATFFAMPPNEALEKLSNRPFGRVLGAFYRRKIVQRRAPPPEDFRNEGPFADIISSTGNTPIAAWLRACADGWLASPTIPGRDRLLMLAVIARYAASRGETAPLDTGDGVVRTPRHSGQHQKAPRRRGRGARDRGGRHRGDPSRGSPRPRWSRGSHRAA
jgi:alkylhydroperoxidase family enzyme